MPDADGATGRLRTVIRPDLLAALDRGAASGITLISGPPGSGKSLLIRSWAERSRQRVAWVSVERAAADPHDFWGTVIAALRAAAGAQLVTGLAPSPDFDAEGVLERLRTELDVLERQVVLVIDDLHEVGSTDVLRQLDRFLSRAPRTLRVIIAFRGEVRLRLHALRLAGALSEIRAADLLFTLDEARELLAASGVALAEPDLLLLHERAEGWAAGLRLAALSLVGHSDPRRFVAEFSGTERTVADYLLSEVLERQPAEVRRFLLHTSILERLSGPLADALTGGSGGAAILRRLEEDGVFLVALGDDRTWFRYHHLFADLLRLELRRSSPEELPRLHAVAAEWLATDGQVVEAIGHAQAAGQWGRAVGLLSDHYFSLTLDGRQATARGLLRSFPRDVMATVPELALMLAADELAQGSLDASAAHVTLAIRHAGGVAPERRRRFEVGLALVRMSLARRRGDFESVVDLIPNFAESDPPETWHDITMHNDLRAWALMNLGIVEAWSGRSTEAARHLQEGRELARSIGRPYLEVGCLAHWASTVTNESFARAQVACHQAIDLATQHGWEGDPVIAPALVTLAACLGQTGRFDEAALWLGRAERALRAEVEPAVGFVLHGLAGALALSRGETEDALVSFARAERLGDLLVSPARLTDQFRAAALRARLASGQIEAVREALKRLTAEEGERGEFREVAAELAVADHDPHAALDALAPVLDGSAPVHHVSVVIRAWALRAVVLEGLGETVEAQTALERALDLAEPDLLVMPFAHTGSRELLVRHPRHSTAHGAFLAEVLDVLAGTTPGQVRAEPAAPADALTEVELRVLRFLPTNLTGTQIAGELYLSPNTVKTHMRHLYSKLDAHTRAQAVDRARTLGLLAPAGRRG